MSDNDVGLTAVADLFTDLMVDGEWVERRPRGFTWWSDRLAQHVQASPPVMRGGREVCEVRVWTDIAKDVEPSSNVLNWLAAINMNATLSAVIWNPADGRVADCCSVMVHPGNLGWVRKVLPVVAVMQNAAAHSRAKAIADALDCNPDFSHHPDNGERPEADEMLDAPSVLINTSKSKFVGTMTRRLEALTKRIGLVGFAGQTEFSCELPFTGVTPVAVTLEDGEVETSLLQVFSDIEHPDYGAGALMTLSLPVRIDSTKCVDVSNKLNCMEFLDLDQVWRTDSLNSSRQLTLTGAWCPDPRSKTKDRVAFTTFVPGTIARPGLLENLVTYQALRSRFAAYQLAALECQNATDAWFESASEKALLEAIASTEEKETPDILPALTGAATDAGAAKAAREVAANVVAATRQSAAHLRVQPARAHSTVWFSAVANRG